MIKTFLILAILQNFLYSQQIILVISDNFTSSKATLTCYEDSKKVFNPIPVNLGRNGLGWGIGEIILKHKKNDPIKVEGDGKAPAGIFKLSSLFGYEKQTNYKLNYIHLDENLICVDDSNSKNYNKIIKIPKNKPKSFEVMKREDDQYRLGVVVEHNFQQMKFAGSCIFIHVHKKKNASTAGCTSMSLLKLKQIVDWLDRSKTPILIQIPRNYIDEVKKLYPNLDFPPFYP